MMMKDQQPDKLFSDKLYDYQKPVPSGAWDRIESKMKKKAFPYWRVAAAVSILIISGLATVLWFSGEPGTQTVATGPSPTEVNPDERETPVDNKEKFSPLAEADEKSRSDEPEQTSPQVDNKAGKSAPDVENTNAVRAPEPQTENRSPKMAERSLATQEHSPVVPDQTIDQVRLNEEPLIAAVDPEQSATNADQSVTIVLSAEETNAYLIKNNTDEATPEEKKTSTLKKVLKKASEIKNNNDDPVGNLRQMKDELLALNFKSDKRGQNK